MWIARDIDNHLHLFLLKPIRNIDHWISTANDIDIYLPSNLYPEIKWERGQENLF